MVAVVVVDVDVVVSPEEEVDVVAGGSLVTGGVVASAEVSVIGAVPIGSLAVDVVVPLSADTVVGDAPLEIGGVVSA